MKRFLLFQNPKFHVGENITVRRGCKWYDTLGKEPLNVNPWVTLGSTEIDDPGLSSYVMRFYLVPFMGVMDHMITDEHDPECRTVAGLTKAMHKVYPDFNPLVDDVTFIHFWVEAANLRAYKAYVGSK